MPRRNASRISPLATSAVAVALAGCGDNPEVETKEIRVKADGYALVEVTIGSSDRYEVRVEVDAITPDESYALLASWEEEPVTRAWVDVERWTNACTNGTTASSCLTVIKCLGGGGSPSLCEVDGAGRLVDVSLVEDGTRILTHEGHCPSDGYDCTFYYAIVGTKTGAERRAFVTVSAWDRVDPSAPEISVLR